jgi:hypothetical protein
MRVTYDGRRYISIMNLVKQINENNITFTTTMLSLKSLMIPDFSNVEFEIKIIQAPTHVLN